MLTKTGLARYSRLCDSYTCWIVRFLGRTHICKPHWSVVCTDQVQTQIICFLHVKQFCQPLRWWRSISQKSTLNVLIFFAFWCRRSSLSPLRISRGRLPDMLPRSRQRQEGIHHWPHHPPDPSLHVTEQVRTINSSCSPLLHACGRGYELAWARPLSTMVSDVNTFLSEAHSLHRDSLHFIVFLKYYMTVAPSCYHVFFFILQFDKLATLGVLYSLYNQQIL